MGEDIRVNAKIYNMKGFSAHADKQQLLAWYSSMKEVPKAFFVTHGELDAAWSWQIRWDAIWARQHTSRTSVTAPKSMVPSGRCMNPKWFRLSLLLSTACLHAWHGTRLSAAAQQNRTDCGA